LSLEDESKECQVNQVETSSLSMEASNEGRRKKGKVWL